MGVEILDNGTRVLTAPGATFGTDALLLARFAQPRRNERALDLCSGCGIVSLVWHDAGHRGPCTALEIDPAASALCAAALAENADAAHIAPVCGDLRQLCTAGPEQGQYDFAACNPPYFTAGPRSPDPRRAEARHTGSCTTADAVDCARRALRDGGRFLLCQRPEQLAEILAALRAARLEPKRLAFVKNRPDAAPWLFLVEAQKGRKTGLRVEPDILIQSGAALYGPTLNIVRPKDLPLQTPRYGGGGACARGGAGKRTSPVQPNVCGAEPPSQRGPRGDCTIFDTPGGYGIRPYGAGVDACIDPKARPYPPFFPNIIQ